MASAYTTGIRLEKPSDFSQNNVWGETVNTNMDKLDFRLSRELVLDVSSPLNNTLTTSDTAAAQTESCMYKFTGSLVASKAVIFPSTFRGVFAVRNTVTFNSFTLTIQGGGGVNTVSITDNRTRMVFVTSDGVEELIIPENTAIVNEIRMFSGSEAALPFGWYVCDGTNNTPDLRGRFIQGSNEAGANQTGGSTTATTNDATVTATGTTAEHTLTEAEIPSHRHFSISNFVATVFGGLTGSNQVAREVSISGNNDQYVLSAATSEPTLGRTSATGGGQGHSHTYSMDAGAHNHNVTVTPPYYTLMFIQYKGV